MGIKPYTPEDSGRITGRTNSVYKELEGTRKKMEAETRTFIEATKKFSLEWVQREMNSNIFQLKSEVCPENVEAGKNGLSKLLRLENLPFRIQDIVEENLNRDDYWIHRSISLHADISRDYIEFKKEKTRKDLTSSIRMILGCAAEIFADLKDENPEDKVWVKERGKRKYICILRFSDEMTASLDSYFSMLEELFVLEYEISKRIEEETANRKSREGKNKPEKSSEGEI